MLGSQISLSVMPHATLVHKLPYELLLEPLHATVVQKLPLNLFLKLLHGAVVQKLLFEAISWALFGTVVQKLSCGPSLKVKCRSVFHDAAMCF